MRKITIIVAASENSVIGYKNALPWHISEDLKNFKKITINHSVIMGRKTFESMTEFSDAATIIVIFLTRLQQVP